MQMEEFAEDTSKGRFILLFIGAYDIPASDFMPNTEPFLRAYICDSSRIEDGKYVRICDIIQTPRRTYAKSIIWNTFRNFKCSPPNKAILTIELLDSDSEASEILASVSISVDDNLANEDVKVFKLECKKSSHSKKFPKCSVLLRRVFIDRPPPQQKTFFLLRHGESKWNNAQKMGSISGLLNLDHSLTPAGVQQSCDLNDEWTRCIEECVDEDNLEGKEKEIKKATIGTIDINALASLVSSSTALYASAANSTSPSAAPSLASSPNTMSMLHLNLSAITQGMVPRANEFSPPTSSGYTTNVTGEPGAFVDIRSRSNSELPGLASMPPPRDSPRSSRTSESGYGTNGLPLSARSRSDSEDGELHGKPSSRGNSFSLRTTVEEIGDAIAAAVGMPPSSRRSPSMSESRKAGPRLSLDANQANDVSSSTWASLGITSTSISPSGAGKTVDMSFQTTATSSSDTGTPQVRSRSQSLSSGPMLMDNGLTDTMPPLPTPPQSMSAERGHSGGSVMGIAMNLTIHTGAQPINVSCASSSSELSTPTATTNSTFSFPIPSETPLQSSPSTSLSSSPAHKHLIPGSNRSFNSKSGGSGSISLIDNAASEGSISDPNPTSSSQNASTTCTSANTFTSMGMIATDDATPIMASLSSNSGDADEFDMNDDDNEAVVEEDEDLDSFTMLSPGDRSCSFTELKARRAELRKMFLHSSRIYSSPLTRAVETACIALRQHPAIDDNGITLLSIIRELKGVGSFDSVGTACGPAIFDRVYTELEAKIGKEECNKCMQNVTLHTNDAGSQWWTNISSFDSKEESRLRQNEFLNFLQHCGDDHPIFVGHSLFFKYFYSRRVSRGLLARRPELAADLKRFKLGNATVLAVTMQFADYDKRMRSMIIDAELVFGNGFHETDKDKELLPRMASTDNMRDDGRDSEILASGGGVQPTISSLGRFAAATTREIGAKITGHIDKLNLTMASRMGSMLRRMGSESERDKKSKEESWS